MEAGSRTVLAIMGEEEVVNNVTGSLTLLWGAHPHGEEAWLRSKMQPSDGSISQQEWDSRKCNNRKKDLKKKGNQDMSQHQKTNTQPFVSLSFFVWAA